MSLHTILTDAGCDAPIRQRAPSGVACSAELRSLSTGLERIGWALVNVEIDVPSEAARIELRRDRLFVTFDAKGGKASITRETLAHETVKFGRRGDIFRADRVRFEFLGRTSGLGLRSGLRALSHYVADNALRPIAHEQARNLFRPLLSAQVSA